MVSPVTGDMTASCRRGWTAEQAYGSLSQRYFPVGPRALERWPLQYHIVNRRALVETTELFAVAERMLKSAPFFVPRVKKTASA